MWIFTTWESVNGYNMELICIADIPQKVIRNRKPSYSRCSLVLRTQWECKTAKVGKGLAVGLVPRWRAWHTHIYTVSCGQWNRQWIKTASPVRHTKMLTYQAKEELFFWFHPLFRVIADLRIPLMWKDTEYFKNKGGEVPPLHSCVSVVGY